MKLTKRQLKRIIKEEKAKLLEVIENPRSALEQELSRDDAVDKIGEGEYEMYCDEHNGQQELEYIIDRLRTIYAMGGGVGKITIYDIRGSGLVRESGYDHSKTYPAISYDSVFDIIAEMFQVDEPADVIAAELASGIFDREQLEAALEEAQLDASGPQDVFVKTISLALDYMGTSRFAR